MSPCQWMSQLGVRMYVCKKHGTFKVEQDGVIVGRVCSLHASDAMKAGLNVKKIKIHVPDGQRKKRN